MFSGGARLVDSVYEKEITSNGGFGLLLTENEPLTLLWSVAASKTAMINLIDPLGLKGSTDGARTETPHELLEYHFCRGALDEYGP